MSHQSFQALSGVVAAPLLPMLPDESIDQAALERYLDWIASQRPSAIAVNMDASEGPSLSRDEQLDVLARTVAVVAGRCAVYSGLVASSTADAVR